MIIKSNINGNDFSDGMMNITCTNCENRQGNGGNEKVTYHSKHKSADVALI